MEIAVKILHVFVSVFLVLVVLLQAGRGGGMGAAFGGASAQIFGGRGASNFLSRVTSALAVVFFLTSLSLSMMSSQHQSVMRGRPDTGDSKAEEDLPSEAAEPDRGAGSAEPVPEAAPSPAS